MDSLISLVSKPAWNLPGYQDLHLFFSGSSCKNLLPLKQKIKWSDGSEVLLWYDSQEWKGNPAVVLLNCGEIEDVEVKKIVATREPWSSGDSSHNREMIYVTALWHNFKRNSNKIDKLLW